MRAVSEHERRFAVRLANIRRLRGMTQEQLATACGLHRSVIAAIETAGRGIRLSEAVELCAALGVGLAEMVGTEPVTLRIETPVD